MAYAPLILKRQEKGSRSLNRFARTGHRFQKACALRREKLSARASSAAKGESKACACMFSSIEIYYFSYIFLAMTAG
jgi:hypothetical protein